MSAFIFKNSANQIVDQFNATQNIRALRSDLVSGNPPLKG